MSRVRTLLWLLTTLIVVGCNNNNGSAVSFAFNRPERLDFACLAQYTDPALAGAWVTLPRTCCTLYDPSNYHVNSVDPGPTQPYPDQGDGQEQCQSDDGRDLGTPTLHALVTQSTRGEVAAVDMVAERVLDSDRQIPGFTFLDTGGLPTAIVVPSSQPKGDGREGPTFFYVASAEEQAVRALPLCRFRNGSTCGPDRAPANEADPFGYEQRLRVALPGAPEDMILGPDQALWVTIPVVEGETGGLLARIELPAAGVTDDAFALDPTTNLPPQPRFFRVPAMGNLPLAQPVADAVDYSTSCGLGASYQPASFTLPLAPRLDAPPSSEPMRFRYDAESGLLFVSDRGAPGLHVFRPGLDGSLTALGALATGQPVREFVLTPRVPTSAVSGQALLARTAPAEDASSETKRYLYAIDALGTVAVYDFVADGQGGLPTLTPLLAPAPDITQARYADRIDLPAPAQTLDVIDTRTQSAYVCGQESIDDLHARRNALLRQARVGDVARELDRIEARIVIHDTAANDYLRGVFVGVVSTAGRIALLDVHDLDTSCRAQRFCCDGSGGTGDNGVPLSCLSDTTGQALTAARSTDAQQSVAVRRHAMHRYLAGPQSGEIGSSSLLWAQACDASDARASVPLARQGELSFVCAPADAYQQLNETWRVDWQGALPSSLMAYAHWETVPGNDAQLALVAPTAFDLCALGVELGDLVAVVGRAPEGLRGQCPDPSADSAPLFRIVEARADRLLVEASLTTIANESAEDRAARAVRQRQDALRCYPDSVGVELRSGGFLVLGDSGSYLHRTITGADGTCIADPAQDPLFDSRVRAGTIVRDGAPVAADVFRNPFVSFALAPAGNEQVLPETRETSVAITRASTPLFLDTVSSGDAVAEAQPSALQYMPEQGYLFVLDTAGQGLRLYTLRPFERDDTVYR